MFPRHSQLRFTLCSPDAHRPLVRRRYESRMSRTPENSPTVDNLQALSVTDLLAARDLYHHHLTNKPNVVGTAIGRYLIREQPGGARTLVNSRVEQGFSWPCVMVFISDWAAPKSLTPYDYVPKQLFMPDGRVVPVCKVQVDPAPVSTTPRHPAPARWPTTLLGGGLPIVVDVQNQSHTATAGCLVSDGHSLYALTNRHVCGPAGQEIDMVRGLARSRVGVSSGQQLTRLPFGEVYPFSMTNTYLTLDIGLVDVDDAGDWTSTAYGIGDIGPMVDTGDMTNGLDLIGQPVVAHGASSGLVAGKVMALFYRYKSMGGSEYVSDFLIAPDPQGPQTVPGDSGMVWHLTEDRARPAPLAVEWGGQAFLDDTTRCTLNFALATSLSTVCNLLDVEPVVGQQDGAQPFWGQTGHYSIATFTLDAIRSPNLKTLMQANLDAISFSLSELDPKSIAQRLKEARSNPDGIIPLADVPDLIWKNLPSKVVGGRDDHMVGYRSQGPEHPCHYADIDEPGPDGSIVRDLCLQDIANLTVAKWQQFYDERGHSTPDKRGLLPFRVWQFYDAMVGFAKSKQVDQFVCAAGLLAHYVGDASQPLHGSYLADGYPDGTGAGVHSCYESKMIDRYARQLVAAIPADLTTLGDLELIDDGQHAALATVELMDRSAQRLPPTQLVDAFVALGGKPVVATQDGLWSRFGEQTGLLMADSARTLAMIWDSAWAAGNGDKIKKSALQAIPHDRLRELYQQRQFVESLDLDHVETALR